MTDVSEYVVTLVFVEQGLYLFHVGIIFVPVYFNDLGLAIPFDKCIADILLLLPLLQLFVRFQFLDPSGYILVFYESIIVFYYISEEITTFAFEYEAQNPILLDFV